MPADSRSDELARVRQERDLYLRLLSLGAQQEIEPFLKEALALIVDITGARQGYLELRAEEEGAEPAWWIGLWAIVAHARWSVHGRGGQGGGQGPHRAHQVTQRLGKGLGGALQEGQDVLR